MLGSPKLLTLVVVTRVQHLKLPSNGFEIMTPPEGGEDNCVSTQCRASA